MQSYFEEANKPIKSHHTIFFKDGTKKNFFIGDYVPNIYRHNIRTIEKFSFRNSFFYNMNNSFYLKPDFDVYPEEWKNAFADNYHMRKIAYKNHSKRELEKKEEVTEEEKSFMNNFLIKLTDNDRIQLHNKFYGNKLKNTGAFFAKSASKLSVPVYQEDNIIKSLIPYKLANRIAIAGGSIVNSILNLPVTDYDVYFIVDNDHDTIIKEYLMWLDATFEMTNYKFYGDIKEFTITVNDKIIKLQLITRFYKDIQSVVCGFDIPACMVMYHDNNYYATALSKLAFQTRTNYVDPTVVSNNYCDRLMKYAVEKGFIVKVPGFTCEELIAKVDIDLLMDIITNSSYKFNRTLANNLCLLIMHHLKYDNELNVNLIKAKSDYCEAPMSETRKTLLKVGRAHFIKQYINDLEPTKGYYVYPKRYWYKKFFDSAYNPQFSDWYSFLNLTLVSRKLYYTYMVCKSIEHYHTKRFLDPIDKSSSSSSSASVVPRPPVQLVLVPQTTDTTDTKEEKNKSSYCSTV